MDWDKMKENGWTVQQMIDVFGKEETVGCRKCEMLFELYNQAPKCERNYWVMTELFVMLHGGDVCDFKNQRVE